jgi:hypothetical protein
MKDRKRARKMRDDRRRREKAKSQKRVKNTYSSYDKMTTSCPRHHISWANKHPGT